MLQCLAAVANEALCESLAQKLPVSVNFLNYVAIVMLAKDDLRFKVLSAEGTQLVENTRNARLVAMAGVGEARRKGVE